MIDAHSGYPTDASGYMHQVRAPGARPLSVSMPASARPRLVLVSSWGRPPAASLEYIRASPLAAPACLLLLLGLGGGLPCPAALPTSLLACPVLPALQAKPPAPTQYPGAVPAYGAPVNKHLAGAYQQQQQQQNLIRSNSAV